MKKLTVFFAAILHAYPLYACNPLKEQEDLKHDLERLRIHNNSSLHSEDGAIAICEAINKDTQLCNPVNAIKHVAQISPGAVNYTSCNFKVSVLMLAVHGTFHIPVEQVQTLFACGIDIKAIANKDALCELYKSSKYLPDDKAKKNAMQVAELLILKGLRCAHNEHWDKFKKHTFLAETPQKKIVKNKSLTSAKTEEKKSMQPTAKKGSAKRKP